MKTANFLDYTLFTSGETLLLRKPNPIEFVQRREPNPMI